MVQYVVYNPADGQIVLEGNVPTREDVSSGPSFEYVIIPKKFDHLSLEELKASVWTRVKERKYEKTEDGVDTTYGKVSTDLVGQTVLNRLVNQALIDSNGSQVLTLATNETIRFDNKDILAIGTQVNNALNYWHMKAQNLRQVISSVEDIETLLKIDTISGWTP